MLDTIEIVKLIGNYGIGVVCVGVLIGLHVYNVRVTLPTLAETSQKQVSELVLIFRQELAEERRQCHEDHEKLFVATSENERAIQANQASIQRLLDRHG